MSMFKMILSWIPGWTKEEEKQRTINEIRDGKSENYKGYAKREYPYRILSSLYIFSLVVILGVIAYRTRVVTYRAPFPSGEEKTNITVSIEVFMVITDSSLSGIGEEVKQYMNTSFDGIEQPLPVTIQGKINNIETRSLSSLLSDSSYSSSLDIFIALVPSKEWPHFSATSVFLTKGKWALVQIREGEESSKVLTRIEHLLFDVLIGIPHLELIVKRDRRERIEPWHIATMSPQHKKRLGWDCNALFSSYSLRIIHLHYSSSSPSSSLSNLPSAIHSTLLPSIYRFASMLKDVSILNTKSEHIFDVDLLPFLVEDVQGRQTINHNTIHELLREIDSVVSPTQSTDPQLKIVIIHSNMKIIIVDGEGEDVPGASISEWGGVIVNDNDLTGNVLSSLRMLLGIDSYLPPSFKRDSVPISQWELTRLTIRNIVDSSLRTKHSIKALRSLIKDIDNLVFSVDLSSLISSSISSLSNALSNPHIPSLNELKHAVTSAESALMDSSLLSLLYFPTEQKFGIFLPLIALYFAPALFLFHRIVIYCIFRI
ncbi:hpo-5 [Pristionchus pacificus]|nr:hpo-5 [Pristionchus pacificus]